MTIETGDTRLHGLRHFATELFTVTFGVVIALALGNLVQRHRDAALAQQARQGFIAELTENRDRVAAEIRTDGPVVDWLGKMIGAAEARLHHQSAKFPEGPGGRSFPKLPDTAWATALATQAISQLSFAEVRALSAAYSKQTALNDLVARARDQWVGMASYGDSLDDGAQGVPDDVIRKGVGDVQVSYAYAKSIAYTDGLLVQSYDAALKALGK
jgi:hypothetical protein